MDIQQLSKQYTVRHLSPEDAAMVYEILRNHTILYRMPLFADAGCSAAQSIRLRIL